MPTSLYCPLRNLDEIISTFDSENILINKKGDGEDPEAEEAERQRLMGLAMSL